MCFSAARWIDGLNQAPEGWAAVKSWLDEQYPNHYELRLGCEAPDSLIEEETMAGVGFMLAAKLEYVNTSSIMGY